MIGEIPAGLILIAAGLALPLVPRAARGGVALLAPALALAQLLWVGPGYRLETEAFGFTLQLVRTDRLSLAFGYIFTIAAFLNALYSWHQRDGAEQPAALVYAGSALAAVFAGDFLTLFVFWELSAIAAAAGHLGQWTAARLRRRACAISPYSSLRACCSPPARRCAMPTRVRSRSISSGLARPPER